MRLQLRAVLLAAVLASATGCGGSTTESDDPSADTAATSAASDAGSPFCVAVKANMDAGQVLATLAQSGGAPAEEFGNVADTVRRTNQEVVGAAPTDLRADFETLSGLADLQLEILEANGGDPASLGRSQEYTQRLQEPALIEIGQRLPGQLQQRCGINSGAPR
ncbi:hypothetical protein ACVGVM_09090 [Pseudonocardia bannensis]|uniref:Lipoprotein n=1 Tax=Pseudonocardia bannensis TaxID=630973 RepID=A0A848DCG2_9PSEU|nr:hypothetical protein [Pseudonocardia bannensis]NMH90288.1 hypothetical protein [Pseudonocardia bannensis]